MNTFAAATWVSGQARTELVNHAPGLNWTHATSLVDLKRCLRREGCCVVVEVGHRGDPPVELADLLHSLQGGAAPPVLLLISLMEGAVREALAYRLWNEVEIFVVGSDSWSSLPDILADLVARPAKGSLASRLTALPANLANAMLMAAEHPADWPLKRILAEAGTSRSTLERRLQELGLPSPGALLRYFAHDARRRA